MTSKIKSLGFSIVAIAAMSMVAASAAQASEGHATTSRETVSIFGKQAVQHVFKTESGSVKCKSATFEGTASDQGQSLQQLTTTEVTLTPTYTECTAFGQPAQIDMNGCKYTITDKSIQSTTTAQTAYVDITGCTTGTRIEITPQLACVVTVPEQHNLSHVVLTNNPEPGTQPHDLTVNLTISGIAYETHGECPSLEDPCKQTLFLTNGQYTGQATFQAREDEGSEQVTHTSHQYEKLKQTGNLVGLEAT